MKLQKKQNRMGVLLVSPFFIGCTVFYFAPFIISIYYSFTSGGKEKQFVGINNFFRTAGYFLCLYWFLYGKIVDMLPWYILLQCQIFLEI